MKKGRSDRISGHAAKLMRSLGTFLLYKHLIFFSQDKLTIGKRKRNEDDEAPVGVEMAENTDNPLRCPVRLYEFYLSKW